MGPEWVTNKPWTKIIICLSVVPITLKGYGPRLPRSRNVKKNNRSWSSRSDNVNGSMLAFVQKEKIKPWCWSYKETGHYRNECPEKSDIFLSSIINYFWQLFGIELNIPTVRNCKNTIFFWLAKPNGWDDADQLFTSGRVMLSVKTEWCKVYYRKKIILETRLEKQRIKNQNSFFPSLLLSGSIILATSAENRFWFNGWKATFIELLWSIWLLWKKNRNHYFLTYCSKFSSGHKSF